ncbi:excisionase [Nitrobacter hamburgensis]|uniref:excisionase n=1 Tax=Nitrobacter hamburgensis TaxID=912 RepID=UPI0018DC4FDF|nr:excisionase [Nitrobacter hamburgensis]
MNFPAPETVTPTTPLRLEVAAELGFPGGSMTAASLRRLVVAKKLAHEKIAGKYFVTLSAIEEMRALCRVPAKAPDLPSKDPATGIQPGSSETDNGPSALAAMNAIAEGLKENLRPTSSKSTTRKKRSAKVIRIASR